MKQNTRLGIWLMIATVFVFATQDALSRHLADTYNTLMIVMIRYWFFAAFVIALAARKSGGLLKAAPTHYPVLQPVRGVLLAAEVCVMVYAFTKLGLINAHAVFTATPLLVAALSGPVLGEKVGWRRWVAIGIGCIGVLIVLGPGSGVFSLNSLIPALSASMFALYSLLTRYVARKDTTATSFFWTGTVGAVFMTVVGVSHWQPMTPQDWGWMAMYCLTASLSHWLLIKCYEVAEASAVQPFAYLHLVFASVFGIVLFGESLRWNTVIGASLVVAAGLFTLWRERVNRMRVAAIGDVRSSVVQRTIHIRLDLIEGTHLEVRNPLGTSFDLADIRPAATQVDLLCSAFFEYWAGSPEIEIAFKDKLGIWLIQSDSVLAFHLAKGSASAIAKALSELDGADLYHATFFALPPDLLNGKDIEFAVSLTCMD